MRVLFVDDEPNILSGLRRILRPLRNDWEMIFEEGGESALEKLEDAPCDVIVSDMKMPGMDGAEFLSQVREKFPASIRIALSGETDSHMIYRCVQHAHQYLAKPCDADMLVSAVKRAFSLRELMNDDNLEAVVANMTSLPSLPEQYGQIMQELQSEDPSLQKVGEVIESDVAMSAKILQLVNSAFFGLARHMSSPSEAAMYLGVDVLKSLVLTTGVFSQFEDNQVDPHVLHDIWTHSTAVGSLAKKIARAELDEDLLADYALMGGLLIDVGKLVFATNFPEEFSRVPALMESSGIADHAAEVELIGHSHMDVGAYLVGLWGLPNPVVECVAYHHKPRACVESRFTPLAAVHIAHGIVASDGAEPLAEIDEEYADAIGATSKISGWIELFEKHNAAGGEA
jgi:putative nucleotidyltransferase with HDIG domain